MTKASRSPKYPILTERPEMTAGEVARMLGITRQAVYLRSIKGQLPTIGVTPDGVHIFSRAEIERIRDLGQNWSDYVDGSG